MLNTNEQAKGGFGAQAERQQEHLDDIAHAKAMAEVVAPADVLANATNAGDDAPESGSPSANVTPPATGRTVRAPKRWR